MTRAQAKRKQSDVVAPVKLELAGQGKDPSRVQLAIAPNLRSTSSLPVAEAEINLPQGEKFSEAEILHQIDRAYARFDEAYTTARAADKAALQFAREHGAWLLEAKKLTKHGEWTKWVDEFCQERGRAARTLRLHMQIAKEWEQICKLATVANFEISQLGVKDAVTLLGMDRKNFKQLPIRQEDALVELEQAQEMVAPHWEVKRLSNGSLQMDCKIPDRSKSFNFQNLTALELAWNARLKDETDAALAASQAIAAEKSCMNCAKWCERYNSSVGKNEVWCGFLRTAIAVERVAEMPEICGKWSDGKPDWVVNVPAQPAPVEPAKVDVEVLQPEVEPIEAFQPVQPQPPLEYERPRPMKKAIWKPTRDREVGAGEFEVQIVSVQIFCTTPDGKAYQRTVPIDELAIF